jgi:heme/copper-type cytochrome/quinol oxidase subunit 4
MSLVGFAICLVLGAAAIALWITVRFPELKPQRLGIIVVHLVIAMVLARLVPFGLLLPVSNSAAVQLIAGIFVVALPVLVYTLVGAIWLVQVAQRALGGMLR